MTEKVKDVKYYIGELQNGCVHDDLEPVYFNTKSGYAELRFYVPLNHFIMQKINVIATFTTTLGNTYITQKSYNLSIENKLL